MNPWLTPKFNPWTQWTLMNPQWALVGSLADLQQTLMDPNGPLSDPPPLIPGATNKLLTDPKSNALFNSSPFLNANLVFNQTSIKIQKNLKSISKLLWPHCIAWGVGRQTKHSVNRHQQLMNTLHCFNYSFVHGLSVPHDQGYWRHSMFISYTLYFLCK